jgi:5'-nucleotidase
MNDPTIVLTNDDGIRSPGLTALYDSLTEIGDVTVVAPSADNSGVGRVLSMGRSDPFSTGELEETSSFAAPEYSYRVPFEDHELGYEVDGTPADCVVAAVLALDLDPDIVVSGCNPGPNAGHSVFGRSGTVSAAVESAFLDVPSIAVSSMSMEKGRDGFEAEGEFTRALVEFSLRERLFEEVDLLNTLVPSDRPERVRITEPADDHDVDASIDDAEDAFRFTHHPLRKAYAGDPIGAPAGTDHRAITDDVASISPLRLPAVPVDCDALRTFAERYPGDRASEAR